MLATAMLVGLLLASISSLSFIGYSGFAGILTGMSAKIAWNNQIRGRLRYCTKCAAYRWHVPMKGKVYCNKCGHEWQQTEAKVR
ncbi:hypothetical protein J2P12_02430 [Candidatus Bathyarchaeota archaeon]|nr:hypothetical protein [Candidatus Bathyarchaeota archaeon]